MLSALEHTPALEDVTHALLGMLDLSLPVDHIHLARSVFAGTGYPLISLHAEDLALQNSEVGGAS